MLFPYREEQSFGNHVFILTEVILITGITSAIFVSNYMQTISNHSGGSILINY